MLAGARLLLSGAASLALLVGCNEILELDPLAPNPDGNGVAGSSAAAGSSSGDTAAAGHPTAAGSGQVGGFGGGTFAGSAAASGGAAVGGSGGASGAANGGASGTADAGGSAGNGQPLDVGGKAGSAGSGGAAPETCPLPLDFAPKASVFPLTNGCWHSHASDCDAPSGDGESPEYALDCRLETRFSTGVYMEPGTAFEYELDLRSVVSVTRVVLKSMTNDYARQLKVFVSEDGQQWRPVACGPGALVTDFWFASSNARYVKLVQGGTGPGWWSLNEVVVYGDATDTCNGYVGVRTPGTCDVVHRQ